MTILYFAAAEIEGDIDNIVKPILDAMMSVAYLDDRLVERIVAQKFEPAIERNFTNLTPQLAAALDAEAPVVYVRIDDDLAWRIL